eukprot:880354-Rhodomonas_salina.1
MSEGDMQMEAYWVLRKLNVRADYNSHLNKHSHYGYSLMSDAFESVEASFGSHTIDRFAEPHNVMVSTGLSTPSSTGQALSGQTLSPATGVQRTTGATCSTACSAKSSSTSSRHYAEQH